MVFRDVAVALHHLQWLKHCCCVSRMMAQLPYRKQGWNINVNNDCKVLGAVVGNLDRCRKVSLLNLTMRVLWMPLEETCKTDMSKITCFKCGKKGHIGANCKVKSAKRSDEKSSKDSGKNSRKASWRKERKSDTRVPRYTTCTTRTTISWQVTNQDQNLIWLIQHEICSRYSWRKNMIRMFQQPLHEEDQSQRGCP